MILSLCVITSNAYNLLPYHSRSISDSYHHFQDMVGYSVQTVTPITYTTNFEISSWTVPVFYFSTVFCGLPLTKNCISFINIHQNCNSRACYVTEPSLWECQVRYATGEAVCIWQTRILSHKLSGSKYLFVCLFISCDRAS
jgi:hypothetical protein